MTMDMATFIANAMRLGAAGAVVFKKAVGENEEVLGEIPGHLHGLYAAVLYLAASFEKESVRDDPAAADVVGALYKGVAAVFESSLRMYVPALPHNWAQWEVRDGWKVVRVETVVVPLPPLLERRKWCRR